MLVDCDGTRDVKEIKKNIKQNSCLILFATYKSTDIINQVVNKMTNPYIIIDEFHNLTTKDVYGVLDNEDSDCESISSSESQHEQSEFNKLLTNPIPNVKYMFMSATPRLFGNETDEGEDICEEVLGKIEYRYGMGDAINNGYICDYDIVIPTFTTVKRDEAVKRIYKDIGEKYSILPDNVKNIAVKTQFIIKACDERGTRKCIIYTKSKQEANLFRIEIEKQMAQYFYYNVCVGTITDETKKKERTEIIEKFAKAKCMSFICSVHILDECIDIPKCDSIFLTYPCSNKIRNIQRMCRSNRIDEENQYKKSSIYLWIDEYDDMGSFIKHVKEYDSSFHFERIKPINTNSYDDTSMTSRTNNYEEVLKELEELKNLIIGWKLMLSWDEKLKHVKNFIDEHKKRPSKRSKDLNEKKMARWIGTQIQNYNKNQHGMKNPCIQKKWEQFINDYSQYFMSNEEKWNKDLSEVKNFIDEHKKRPSDSSKDQRERKMGQWIGRQIQNYNKKQKNMNDPSIQKKWEQFINDYSQYLISREDIWNENLIEVKTFMDEHKRRPNKISKEQTEKTMGKWIGTQIQNYKKKQNNMKVDSIRKKWKQFMRKYPTIFSEYI